MNVASSAGPEISHVAGEDEPIPASEAPVEHGRSDRDGMRQFVENSDHREEKLSSAEVLRTYATAACHAQLPNESISENSSGIERESSYTATRMTENSTLCFGPIDGGQRSRTCKDGYLDADIERHGAQSNLSIADDNLDLEKGLSAIRPQMNSHDSNRTMAIAPEKLDRNGSSGEKVCRVCYLGLAGQPESGPAIELGCQCKHDLAFAHRQCAEAWFKIKGNRTCEICGSTVENVSGINDSSFMENWNDGGSRAATASDGERCWQNHRLFNILLACMVFAFVLPWLFHVSSLFR